MLPGAEAMPISFCNIVPASPHIHECHRQPGSDQDASTVLLQVHENTGAAWNGPAAMRNSARRASPLLCAHPHLRAGSSTPFFFEQKELEKNGD